MSDFILKSCDNCYKKSSCNKFKELNRKISELILKQEIPNIYLQNIYCEEYKNSNDVIDKVLYNITEEIDIILEDNNRTIDINNIYIKVYLARLKEIQEMLS